MGMKGFIAVIAAVVTFAIANTAAAEVKYDPEAGTGFVGKGEVQDAFAWNDAAFQQNASSIGFFYGASWSYTVICTGASGSQTYLVGGGVGIVEIDAEARTNPKGKVTGFNLLGYRSSPEQSEAPRVGDACGGGTIAPGMLTSVKFNDDRGDMLFVTAPNLGAPVIWFT
jgi:hypothetical protein